MKPNIGITENDRSEIALGLARVLADSYTLYLKTHNYHWNITGKMFQTLHLFFEQQYLELAIAVDLIAERIRALGERAPGSYKEFAKLTIIKEDSQQPKAEQMITNLLADHESVIHTLKSVFPTAEKGNDEATADLLTQRIQLHEKTAWMLRSMISE